MARHQLPPNTPEFLTVAQVAKLLSVPERTVRFWFSSRRLARHKLGRHVRVAREDLRDMLDRGHVAAVR